MTTATAIDFQPHPPPTAPWWRRLMHRYLRAKAARATRASHYAAVGRATYDSRDRLPVFRITRAAEHRWIVLLPGSATEHVFDQATCAEAFVRQQACGPFRAELRIGDLYIAADLRSDRAPLFNERSGR